MVRKKDLSRRIPPLRAIGYCLDSAGIGFDDLDMIIANNALEPVNLISLGTLLPIKDKSKIHSLPHPSHHLAHAYSAYFCSSFKESAVLIADAFGSQTSLGTEAESGYHAKDSAIEPVFKNYQVLMLGKDPWKKPYYSLTYMYHFVSQVLGFRAREEARVLSGMTMAEAGKTMGLAAYGKHMKGWPIIVETGQPKIETHRFTQWAMEMGIGRIWKDSLIPIPKPKDMKLTQFHAALALKAQEELERGMVFLANRLQERTGAKNLCIAGGAGLNSITNKKILDSTRFENIFVQPASMDDGTAIGCALYGWHVLVRGVKRYPLRHVYLGRAYKKAEFRSALARYKMSMMPLAQAELIQRTAERIAAGKVVGWFQGGSEFGPRALGHRSILADPRRPEMKTIVNRKVKHRENFRPYAPSILLEQSAAYFDLTCPSPFMLLVAEVKKEKRKEIPAVVHVDGTARVQTVSKSEEALYHELIREFHRITGVPVVLNTSFNVRGMPIVEKPDDALRVFFDTHMDVLVLGPYFLEKGGREETAGLIVYCEKNGMPKRARPPARIASKIYEDDGRFPLHLAKLHFASGNYRAAIKAALKGRALAGRDGDIDIHAILGLSFEKMDHFSKAIPELRAAERTSPEDRKINLSLAQCYKRTNKPKLAADEVEKAYANLKRALKGQLL